MGLGVFPSALVIDPPSIPWVDTIWRTMRPCAGYSVLEYTGADVMCIDYIEGEEGERQRGRERDMASTCRMGMMDWMMGFLQKAPRDSCIIMHGVTGSATQDMAKMLQSKNVRQYFVLGTSIFDPTAAPRSSCHPATTDIQSISVWNHQSPTRIMAHLEVSITELPPNHPKVDIFNIF